MVELQNLEKWLSSHVVPVYQPVHELFLSLHVLARPEHHAGRLGWAKEMMANLPLQMRDQLLYFKMITDEYMTIMDIFQPWEESLKYSVEAGLEKIAALTPEAFAEVMIGPRVPVEKVQSCLSGCETAENDWFNPQQRELLQNPEAVKQRLVEFLYNYLLYFRQEHKRVEPWIIRAVHQAQERIEKDPLGFLKEIHPRFHVHDDYLELHKAKTYRFPFHELRDVYVVPSTFAAPHLLLGIYPEAISVGLHVGVPGTEEKAVIAEDFIRVMKALSDFTRASILKSLLRHPYCIRQLAEMHGISEPAVVKHVKILVEAELAWSERRGHYVFYHGVSTRLEQLAVDIHQYLDMPDFADF